MHTTQCTIKIGAQSLRQCEKEDTRENLFGILTFYIDNLVLKISLTLSFCICLFNHDSHTNKHKALNTLQCTLYSILYVPYRPEPSTPETSQGKGPIRNNILCLRRRLVLRSTLGDLASTFNTFKNYRLG